MPEFLRTSLLLNVNYSAPPPISSNFAKLFLIVLKCAPRLCQPSECPLIFAYTRSHTFSDKEQDVDIAVITTDVQTLWGMQISFWKKSSPSVGNHVDYQPLCLLSFVLHNRCYNRLSHQTIFTKLCVLLSLSVISRCLFYLGVHTFSTWSVTCSNELVFQRGTMVSL